MFSRPVLNEESGHRGVKKGRGGGSVRNVIPRAKRDDEGHLQESLNFPLRGVLRVRIITKRGAHPPLTLVSSLSLSTHAKTIHRITPGRALGSLQAKQTANDDNLLPVSHLLQTKSGVSARKVSVCFEKESSIKHWSIGNIAGDLLK